MDLTRMKFQRLNSNDDQSMPLSPIPLDNLQSSNPLPTYAPAQPKRWHSKATRYEHSYTYVQSPTASGDEKKGRRNTGDRFKRQSRLSFISNPVSNFRIPTFAAPWQHEAVDSEDGLKNSLNTVRRFDPKAQSRRLLVNGLLQWLVTVVIVLALAATLFGFSQPAWISKGSKYTFNALITLLSLCLGLAIVTALRSYAKLLSWRFLASQYWNLQDFEAVMNCDSQTKVLKLFRAGRTPGKWLNMTQFLCLLSLFLVIGLQILIGMLGLTYSVDTAAGSVEWTYGNVSVVDLTDICQNSACNNTDLNDPDGHYIDQTAAANFFGLQGQNFLIEDATPENIVDYEEVIYRDDANETFFYQFLDQSPQTTKENNIGVTDRYIVQNATCARLKITQGGFVENDTLGWIDEAGKKWDLNVSDITVLTTTYMSDGSTANFCGERCTRILTLNTGYAANASIPNDTTIEPMLFGCNSTVGQVQWAEECSNITDCSLTNDLARILAGAIGWSGSYYGDDAHSMQYKNYPPGSPYCWYNSDLDDAAQEKYEGDPAVVAWRISQFATSAIAAMDNSGPRLEIPGQWPKTASQLSVEWQYAGIILLIIPIIQLAALFVVWFWAKGSVILDGSFLSTARMLRPVVEKLGGHGCALTADEIARTLGNFNIIYGARAPDGPSASNAYGPENKDPDWRLGIIAESEGYGTTPEEGWNPGKRFPAGKYD